MSEFVSEERIECLITELAKLFDSRALQAAKAMTQTAASVAAICEVLTSKGVCTESELDKITAQARIAIADQLNKDVEDLVKVDLENADEIRKRYADLTSSLTQTSSAPE